MKDTTVSGERHLAYDAITKGIDIKLARIIQETMWQSGSSAIVEHEYYKQLVDMGDRIIPYLFNHMISKGITSWVHFMLLQDITGIYPIQPEHRGKFYHVLSDWMNWYIKSKYIHHDIYYGLLDNDIR